jgi:uncharacterized protein (DUF1778 family)
VTPRNRAARGPVRADRLEARISGELKRRLEYAANIRGTSLTDFVITSAAQAASETIESYEVLRLSERDRAAFVDALLNPPRPNRRLRQAARRYRRLYSR